MRVLTLCNMHSVSGETGTLPHQRPFLRQQSWNLSAYKLVADWLLAVGVELVLIAHLPCPRCVSIIVRHCLDWIRELLPLGIERIAVVVLF